MKPSRFLLQVSVFVLIAFAITPSKGDGYVLKKWMDSAKGVKNIVESSVSVSYNISQDTNIVEIQQIRPIKAAKCEEENVLTAFSNPDSDYCTADEELVSETNFLPWSEDKATFMRLDHIRWGIWFFTSKLSGCDIWIADRKGEFEPLVIHANANSLGNDPVRNLQCKQNLSMMALTKFNQKYNQSYKFIQRISYDFASVPGLSPEQKEQIKEYWNSFKSYKIPFVLYKIQNENQIGFVYGTYSNAKWYFVLKELNSGKILVKIACYVTQSSCDIQ